MRICDLQDALINAPAIFFHVNGRPAIANEDFAARGDEVGEVDRGERCYQRAVCFSSPARVSG